VSQDEVWNLLFIPIYSSHIALRLVKLVHIFGKFSQSNRLILNFRGRHKRVHQKNQKMLWSINYVCLLGDSFIPTTHYCLVFQIYHVKYSYQTELMYKHSFLSTLPLLGEDTTRLETFLCMFYCCSFRSGIKRTYQLNRTVVLWFFKLIFTQQPDKAAKYLLSFLQHMFIKVYFLHLLYWS